jgi:peptidoglycan/LPS O-acetylase OafA/YrhL
LALHVDQFYLKKELPNAALAVDFFFMLSGFVVAHAYEARLREDMRLSAFIGTRLLRLYPLIFLGVLAGTGVAVAHKVIVGGLATWQLVNGAVSGLLLLPCYAFPQWPDAFPMNGPSWSLFFEVFMSVAYALTVRRLTNARLLFASVVCVAITLALSIEFDGVRVGHVKGNFMAGFARVLFPFVCGILLRRIVYRPGRTAYSESASWGCMLALAALLFAPINRSGIGDFICIVVIFPVLVAVGAQATANGLLGRLCKLTGELSYPLYILHQPVLRVLEEAASRLDITGGARFVVMLASIAACALVAFVALRFYDEPIRRSIRSFALSGS